MKNRVVFSLLSGLFVSLLFSLNAFSQETVVRVAPRPLPNINSPQIVDIFIENGQNVAGYQVMLQFDPGFLEYDDDGFQHGDYLPKEEFFGVPYIDKAAGTVRFAATSFGSESNGDGLLATLTFNIIKASKSDLILLEGTLLSNKEGERSVPIFEDSRTFLPAVPDLAVGPLRASPVNASEERDVYNEGERFQLSAIVRNKGTLASAPAKLIVYGPPSTDPEKGNTLGQVNIERLQPNHAIEIPLPEVITVPQTLGTYYYAVCVEGVSDVDRKRDNNCKVLQIRVGPPDLRVSVEAQSSLVAPGTQFELRATLANNRTEESTPAVLQFYGHAAVKLTTVQATSGTLPTIDFADKALGEAINIGAMPANGTATKTITVTAPEEPGRYAYRACVAGEGNKNKTCSAVITITVKVQETAPDLVIESIRAEPNIVAPGGTFTLQATFKNLDPLASDKPLIIYYVSTHDIISPSDKVVAKVDAGESVELTALETPGIYYYGACVDSASDGSNAENVCSNAVKVTVQGISLALPDNLISEVAFSPNATYFIFNPQVPTITGVVASDVTIYGECRITVDIPGVRDEPIGWVETQPPDYHLLPYLMFPVEDLNWGESGGINGAETGKQFLDKTVEVLEDTEDFQQSKKIQKVTKVLPKVVQGIDIVLGILDIFREADASRKARADPKIEIKEGENYHSLLFMIPRRISYVEIEMVRYYQLKSEEGGWNILPWVDPDTHTVKYRGRWNLDEIWQQENPGVAAPRAQPMSLADYPPFQQLSPEIQEYLLQYFGETTTHKTLNPEAWQMPEATTLLANYPNPFNPETWIPYQLAEAADVTLTIYDIHGRVVRALNLGHQPAGIYKSRARAAYWDGRNAVGEPVASGLYFYTFTAGDFTATRKMLIRK